MNTDKFLVKEDSKLDLKKHATDFTGDYTDKDEAVKDLQDNVQKLRELQDVLYAQDHYSLLVIFQAMDAAGKDGAIKHVMSGVNPQGTIVYSFKHPGPEALKHDFLWEASRLLPGRGHIGIFNRSYYEEVLIVRVHAELLAAQSLPEEANGHAVWKKRYRSIRAFEKHLHASGTRVVKIFLHLSKEEQRKRFL